MCSDGGGHITPVHQPFKRLSALFDYVFINSLNPPLSPRQRPHAPIIFIEYLQLDQVNVKAAIGGIYSMYS